MPAVTESTSPLLETRDLTRTFTVGGGRSKSTVQALREANLSIRPGEILGLAGESGSGKSTLARIVAGLDSATQGEFLLDGQAVTRQQADTPWFMERVQMVFQDPTTSLNPRRTIAQSIEVPLLTLGLDGAKRRERVLELLDLVELGRAYSDKYPNALSGGQKQRVSIARALAINPKLVVLDEPTSALDVSVQAKIIALLLKLRDDLGLTYLFITHDLSLMRNITDEVAVMYLGRIVEQAPTQELFTQPRHPYTRMLISAIPVVSDEEEALKPGRIRAHGEIPSPTNLPSGCTFHTRCPWAVEQCKVSDPPEVHVGERHTVRCIRLGEI